MEKARMITEKYNVEEPLLIEVETRVRAVTGINFDSSNWFSLKVAIKERMEATQIEDPNIYLKILAPNSNEMEKLTSLLVVHETYFFRDKRQFDALTEVVLPELIEKKKIGQTKPRIKIMSCGCSFGAEPYSIAISLMESNLMDQADFEIIAFDLNKNAIERAESGEFSSHMFREPDTEFLKKYFTLKENRFLLHNEIKEKVQFYNANLFDLEHAPVSLAGADVVFLRNVLIYFNQADTEKLMQKVDKNLSPEGVLFLGSSESLLFLESPFHLKQIGKALLWVRGSKSIKPTEPRTVSIKPNIKKTEFSLPKDIPLPRKPKPKPPSKMRTQESDDLEEHYENGLGYLKIKIFDKAENEFKEQLKQTPRHIKSLIRLATLYADSDLDQQAIETCQEIIKIDNLVDEIYFVLGLVYFKRGDYQQAIEHFKKGRYCDEKNFVVLYYLALSYRAVDQQKEANHLFHQTESVIDQMEQDQLRQERFGYTADYIYSLCADMAA